MNNKTYDIIKNVALFAAPVLTLISSVISIIGVPWGEKATAICAAVDTCLGSIVVIARANYKGDKKDE
jgi:hypothetical protein